MQYNLAKSTVIAVMKKTDQEIIVSRKHKSGLEIEVLRLYGTGLETKGIGKYYCMATKTDQEIIVSRKHKSGLEIGVKLKTRLMTTKNAVGVWGGGVVCLIVE